VVTESLLSLMAVRLAGGTGFSDKYESDDCNLPMRQQLLGRIKRLPRDFACTLGNMRMGSVIRELSCTSCVVKLVVVEVV
jgi:hypothetical protein